MIRNTSPFPSVSDISSGAIPGAYGGLVVPGATA